MRLFNRQRRAAVEKLKWLETLANYSGFGMPYCTHEVSANIAGVTAAANETGVSSGRIISAAAGLSGQAAEPRQQVTGFLVRIRAA
jgi:hypothetical protein